MPGRIKLANLPTKIEKLERLSAQLGGPEIYIKRDDQTGSEISGNKIRKLEYSLREAINLGRDTLITCGGIQSNHCRSTAAAAAKLGLKAVLVLRGTEPAEAEGNLLLDKLLGADVRWITAQQYANHRAEIMETIKSELIQQGHQPYIIPEGASNGIGAFGYYNALEEIMAQEQELGITFGGIVVAVGSGSTYAGLLLAKKRLGTDHEIIGFNVCDDEAYFKRAIGKVLTESGHYLDQPLPFSPEEIRIIDGYVGRGYALSRPEEREFIRRLAGLEGIILDPVYTGKAFYGLSREIKKGTFNHLQNILFIHTGGLYGLFPQGREFEFH